MTHGSQHCLHNCLLSWPLSLTMLQMLSSRCIEASMHERWLSHHCEAWDEISPFCITIRRQTSFIRKWDLFTPFWGLKTQKHYTSPEKRPTEGSQVAECVYEEVTWNRTPERLGFLKSCWGWTLMFQFTSFLKFSPSPNTMQRTNHNSWASGVVGDTMSET